MLKRILALLLLAAVIFGGLAALKYRQIQTLSARFSVPQPPTRVEAVTAEARQWGRSLFATGTLAAVQDVNVMSEVPGQIAAIHFESGQVVEVGAVLVTLDASIDEAELRGLLATRKLAEIQLDRAGRLQNDRAMSRSQFDEAVARRDEASAMVGAKEASLAKKKIRAPITGTLGIRRIDLGDYLAPGSQVVTLQALDSMFVDFRLPERFLARLAKGQAVELGVQSQPGKTYRAHVTAIDPAVDPATRMVKVRARLPNSDDELRPGMFAEVRVLEDPVDDVLVVPESAITYSPYGNSAFVIEDDKGTLKVTRRAITTGAVRAGFVAVDAGLKVGERVVAVGQNRLRNGLVVELAPAP